jgi:hypothetical protein
VWMLVGKSNVRKTGRTSRGTERERDLKGSEDGGENLLCMDFWSSEWCY